MGPRNRLGFCTHLMLLVGGLADQVEQRLWSHANLRKVWWRFLGDLRNFFCRISHRLWGPHLQSITVPEKHSPRPPVVKRFGRGAVAENFWTVVEAIPSPRVHPRSRFRRRYHGFSCCYRRGRCRCGLSRTCTLRLTSLRPTDRTTGPSRTCRMEAIARRRRSHGQSLLQGRV